MSTVDPAGPAARTIATLWWVMLAGSVLIFGLVMALVAGAFRRRGSAPDDARMERRWIIGLGLAFPVAVLAALLGYGLVAGERLLPRERADLVQVSARASRTAWSFGYADRPGFETRGVLHIPAGRPVDVEITTADVIHSFWVPRLAGKLDAVPGHVNTLRIEADRPGRFAGVSAEFSGPGYHGLGFAVVAHDAEGWADFLEEQAE
ncbi:MAG: cytochrome c oxidase subunit II [Paracoccaceae bacterium]